jgi:hypothetical protein
MSGTIRYYLDADLSPKIAVIGRGLGLDVVSAHEVGMTEAVDADRLAHALRRWATARTTVASYGVYWLPE